MLRTLSILLLAACALQAQAKVDGTQAARLGQDLTPLGGERAGNAAGTIPAWDGGLAQPPANYQPGMHHPDPYSADTPLYQINSQNLAQYQAQLPAGLKALLEKNPDYFLRVFPTRRSAAAPQRIYDATRFNAQTAELISGGNGVAGVAAYDPDRLYPGWRAARVDGRADRDAVVAVLHSVAGASPGRDHSGGGADGNDLLSPGVHQCGVCAQF